MRSLRLLSVVFSLGLIGLGVALLIDDQLPASVRLYWPVLLTAWGVWNIVSQLRANEDMWVGTDYGTGLYAIRHLRRRRGWLLPGIGLILIGAFLLLANLDPNSGITIGPFVAIALGLIALLRSFAPPPHRDF